MQRLYSDCSAALGFVLFLAHAAAAQQPKPNIVFMMVDNLTPTRSAFMTGRMPIRSGTSKVPLPGLPQGLVPWEYTIAELLHDAGYQSAAYGKWHLGDKQGRYPTDQGFDEWYGFPHSSAETLNNIQPGYRADLAPNQ